MSASVGKNHRVQAQAGFILHSYPYKESSVIVEVFVRDYGRIALLAKGARRLHSQLRGILQSFQLLSISWSGKAEVRTLTAAEWVGGLLPLEKSALLYGFYLNELLIKLLARDDPHPRLFDHYVEALKQLAQGVSVSIVLRRFECAVLKETGVAIDWSLCTDSRQAVTAETVYMVDPSQGVRLATIADGWPRVHGKTLINMTREDYSDSETQVESKNLLRFLLAYHLEGMRLNTRQILVDLKNFF